MLRIYDADAVLTISKFLVEEDERDVVEPRVDVSVRVAKLAFYRLQSEEIRRRFRLVGLYTPLPGVLLPSQGTNSACKIGNDLAGFLRFVDRNVQGVERLRATGAVRDALREPFGSFESEIGRASCRERGCQYV